MDTIDVVLIAFLVLSVLAPLIVISRFRASRQRFCGTDSDCFRARLSIEGELAVAVWMRTRDWRLEYTEAWPNSSPEQSIERRSVISYEAEPLNFRESVRFRDYGVRYRILTDSFRVTMEVPTPVGESLVQRWLDGERSIA